MDKMEIVHRHFATLDSTNNWGKENAHELPHDKITLVTADAQTAGRGRFKRKWESPSGQNIYATFCFFIDPHVNNIGNIPQVLAISAANILKKLNFNPTLKWPNDVLISEKKIAGILAETTVVGKMCMVLGIGLNVNMPKAALYVIDRPATSLLAETGRTFDKDHVLSELQEEFSKNLGIFLEKGFGFFLESYREYMPKDPHKILRFHDNRMIWEGTLHEIHADGSLCLKLSNGELKTFIAGEILWPGE